MKLFNTGIELSLPPAHLFTFPPYPEPAALPPPPPTESWTLKSPFAISPALYNSALDVSVPVTFALGYFFFVTLFNQINRQRKWKPWGISKSETFKDFTLVHNVLLAVYSAFTCVAMVRALWVSSPGWRGPNGAVGQVDALCKMQGPRGLGDAISYDPASAKWAAKNSLIHLAPDGLLPDPTDVGRIWNEGLAFWGWLFYLSKFYEVVDTIIILAKGKRATTLQTFHHFGAMFCMWAGMRYMSCPIWLFVMFNSFIHTLMYTFYACSVLDIKVNRRLKRGLTTLQITQFVVGVFFASAHLFVAYETPVSLPYKAMAVLSNSTVASEVAQDWWSDAVQTGRSSGFLPPWAKRLLYRAVGAEGLAESVHDGNIYTNRHAAEQNRFENNSTTPDESHHHRHSRHYQTVRCIDTTGQTFAIWLNVVYLMPLMFLFMRFFVKSYITGPKRSAKAKSAENKHLDSRRFSDHVTEAVRRTSNAIENFGINAEEAIDDAAEETEKTAEAAGEKISQGRQAVKDGYVGDRIQDIQNSETVKQTRGKISEAKQAVQDGYIGDRIEDVKNSETLKQTGDKLSQGMQAVQDGYIGDRIDDVKNSQTVQSASGKVSKAKKAVDEAYIGDKVDQFKNSQIVVDAENAGENMLETIEGKREQVRTMLSKDSTLGDSYVEVLEKMRQGARQVSGSIDAGGHVEEQESKTYGDGPSTATNETVSSSNKKTSSTEESSSSTTTIQSSSSSSTGSTKKENKTQAKSAVKKSQIPRSHSPSKKGTASPSKIPVKREGVDGTADDDVDSSLILGRDNSPPRQPSDPTDPSAPTYADAAKTDVEKVEGDSKDWGFGLNG